MTKDPTTEYHDEEKLGRQIEGGSGVVAMSQEGGKILEQANEGQGWDWGVEEAEAANKKEDASMYSVIDRTTWTLRWICGTITNTWDSDLDPARSCLRHP